MVGVSSSNPYSSMGAQRRLDNSGARTFEQLRNEVGGGAGGSGGDGAGSATVNPMGYAPAASMPGTQGAYVAPMIPMATEDEDEEVAVKGVSFNDGIDEMGV